MSIQLSCTVDTTGLQAGIDAASRYTKRTIPEICNTALYWIALNSSKAMPYVSPERVDRDMGTIVTARIGKRGRALSTKSSKGRMLVSTKELMMDNGKFMPRAAAIVAARARPGSRINAIEHGRRALGKNPFKGVSREAGRAAMKSLVHALLATRRGAGKFLAAGFVEAIRTLKPLVKHKWSPGGANPREEMRSHYHADLGSCTAAQANADDVYAALSNEVGMAGPQGDSFNAALQRHGMPVLQQQVDNEGRRNVEYALKKANEELAAETNRHWR